MAAKLTAREKLEGRRERILIQLAAESTRQTNVVNGLGFGYAMRGYSRLKNMSFSKEEELRDRLGKVEAELVKHGWVDPRKPVQPERSPEEGLRHYCEIMNLDFEEQKKLLESREMAQ